MSVELSSITVQDFKDEFPRAFPYLSNIYWNSLSVYSVGDIVYNQTNETFYKALTTNSNKQPDLNLSDWSTYSDSELNYIIDRDIEKAYRESQATFNKSLSISDEQLILQYLYLTAHFLSLDLKAASQGINSSAPTAVSGKSVGSVSESYSVPTAWSADPNLQFYTTTFYGVKYLSMVLPYLVGNITVVKGATTP